MAKQAKAMANHHTKLKEATKEWQGKKVSNPRCSLERGNENVKLSALPTLTGLGNSPRTHWNSSREQ